MVLIYNEKKRKFYLINTHEKKIHGTKGLLASWRKIELLKHLLNF